jgi:multicomponent Na+:H+ antiporter subunit A
LFDSILTVAPRVVARVQHGSLPVYGATLATAAIIAALPFATEVTTQHLVWWDEPIQAVLSLAIVGSALAGAFVDTRIGAALTLGAVGIGVSGVFVVHGAPDLALTQLLVETIVVVGFIIGLGHLRRRFPTSAGGWRTIRLVVAVAGGVAVTVALAASGSAPSGTAPIAALTDAAVTDGGGNNVVNVVLTDTRALDTLGEVVVLATVAVGILALARVRRQEASR